MSTLFNFKLRTLNLCWKKAFLSKTRLRTQRCPGYSWLLPPFTCVDHVDPLHLESQNEAKNIPVVFPSSPIKFWGKHVKGFWVIFGNKKIKQRLQLYTGCPFNLANFQFCCIQLKFTILIPNQLFHLSHIPIKWFLKKPRLAWFRTILLTKD